MAVHACSHITQAPGSEEYWVFEAELPGIQMEALRRRNRSKSEKGRSSTKKGRLRKEEGKRRRGKRKGRRIAIIKII